jgi:hypothetical protein
MDEKIQSLFNQLVVERIEQKIVGRLMKNYPVIRTSKTDLATLLNQVWHWDDEHGDHETEGEKEKDETDSD